MELSDNICIGTEVKARTSSVAHLISPWLALTNVALITAKNVWAAPAVPTVPPRPRRPSDSESDSQPVKSD